MEAAVSGALDAKAFTEAARGYAELLRAHIAKENNVLFPAAERLLAPDMGPFTRSFRNTETVIGHGRHEELHAMLKALKKKYLA